MKRTVIPGMAAVLAFALAGCISLTQNVKLNADGSAKVTVDTWVDDLSGLTNTPGTAATAAKPSPAAAMAEVPKTAAPPVEPTVEVEMGPAFANVSGVKVEENWAKLEGEADARKTHTHLVMTVDKLEKLNGVGVFKDQVFNLKKKGKTLTFTQLIHNSQEKKDSSAESEAMAKEMFKNYKFTYVLETPSEVKSTNGMLGEDKKTVTWSWPLYEFSQAKDIEMTAATK